MAKVYVSSTLQDLVDERQAVIDWLIAAGHQPTHSYRPDSDTVRASCLEDIDGCDLYVLIQGHRYGFQPADGNPDHLSITQLEFRRATGIPRVALLRQSVPNIALSDLGNPERSRLVLAFIEEVRAAVRPGEFHDGGELITALSTGVLAALEQVKPKAETHDAQVTLIVATLTDELRRKNQQIDSTAAEAAALRSRVTELEQQLRAAVSRTLDAAEGPNPAPGAKAAAVALMAGSTRPAEALLADQERQAASTIGQSGADDIDQRRRAAQLAREQAALASSKDVRSALISFQRAAIYEPDDVETQFLVGVFSIRNGDLSEALAAYRRGHSALMRRAQAERESSRWRRDLSVVSCGIADVLRAQGDRQGAGAAYREALTLAEQAFAAEPTAAVLEHDLAGVHDRLGDLLSEQDDWRGAEAQYRAALEIADRLSVREPDNRNWQRELSVSHNKIGAVLEAQGQRAEAEAAYRTGLAIRQRLVALDADNTDWQRNLSVSHDKLGHVLRAQGDLAEAETQYRAGLEIAERLTARDPANVVWQRDLSINYDRIGSLLDERGDGPGAEEAYRAGLAIAERLAARDPANMDWQRDLSASLTQIANCLEERGQWASALVLAERSLAIDHALSARDPSNPLWHRDVNVSEGQVARLRARIAATPDEAGPATKRATP